MRVPPKTRLLRARLRQRAGECSGTRQHRRNDDDLDRRSECFIRSLGGVSATGETPCRAPNSRAHAKRGFSKLLSRWRVPTSVKGKENRVERTPFFRIERELPTPFDAEPRYALRLFDRWWDWLYLPVARAVQETARRIGYLQQGSIALYLFYSFATLLTLLAFTL